MASICRKWRSGMLEVLLHIAIIILQIAIICQELDVACFEGLRGFVMLVAHPERIGPVVVWLRRSKIVNLY
jgi:hypothetical protein